MRDREPLPWVNPGKLSVIQIQIYCEIIIAWQ